MKRFLGFAVFALAAWPMAAAPSESLPVAAGPTPTLGELMSNVQAARSARSTEGVSLGSGYGFASQLLVPVVIRAPGKNNTFFETDYFLTNGRGFSQDILIGFLPSGVSGVSQPTQRFSLNANTTYLITDFLGGGNGRLNLNGVGALLITGVFTGSSNFDSNAQLYGAARIWTMEPGSSGTNSFTEWAVEPGVIHGSFDVLVIGPRQNSDFRANYGLVNLDVINPRTFTVDISTVGGGSVQTTATIPPLSMAQLAVPSTLAPGSNGYMTFTFIPAAGTDFPWYAFGTSADNITGDAWLSVGVQF
jgi:hypothetical protein